MIVDVHTHLYSPTLAPSLWIEAMARYGSTISGKSSDFVVERIREDWFDETGDRLIEDMDAAGIDKSIVLALDYGLYAGVDDEVSLVRRYELFSSVVRRHSDRLVLFGGIDPRRPDSVRFVKRAVNEWGIKGVKLWTPTGVYPNEPYCYPLYSTCEELGLPIVVHTGQEIPPLQSESGRPILVSKPSSDFPGVTFVLAHAGMAWWEEAANLAWHHPNVYLDIAYWQLKYLRDPRLFARELGSLQSLAGRNKVFFGTDWPALRRVKRVEPRDWIQVIRELPGYPSLDASFTEDDVEWLLGKAAVEALQL